MPKLADVRFKLVVNQDATREQVSQWIKYALKVIETLPRSNPLFGKDILPMPGSLEMIIVEDVEE